MSCTSRVYKNFRRNYEPEVVGEDCWDEVSEVYKLRSEIFVSARSIGNVRRFMNHSCSANAMWQPVEFEKNGQPTFASFYIFLQRGIYLRWQSWGMIMKCLMILERLMKMEAGFLEVKGFAYVVRKLSSFFWVRLNFLLLLLLSFYFSVVVLIIMVLCFLLIIKNKKLI